jgi:hypothetical protein
MITQQSSNRPNHQRSQTKRNRTAKAMYDRPFEIAMIASSEEEDVQSRGY